MKDIYSLAMHEKTSLEDGRDTQNSTLIMRVPGGWLYGMSHGFGREWVFVPELVKKIEPENEKATKV